MGKRLITIGLCAIGLLGVAAGAATASTGLDLAPTSVQLFDGHGTLLRTVDCSTTTSSPCGVPRMGVATSAFGGYSGFRLLDPRGKWYVEGAKGDAVLNGMHASGASAMETDNAYLDSLLSGGASAARTTKHHVRGHGIKKKGHHKR
jgi:hypothetical protein